LSIDYVVTWRYRWSDGRDAVDEDDTFALCACHLAGPRAASTARPAPPWPPRTSSPSAH